jgi:TonB family protein
MTKSLLQCTALLLIASVHATSQTPTPQTAAVMPTSPHDRLVAAAQHSSLNDPDLKPWHLKLDVTVFDAKGLNPIAGTVETWHSGKNSKTVYTFGDSSRTILHNPDDTYEAHSGPDTPAIVDAVLEGFLDPGPSLEDIDASQPDIRTEPAGKVKLDCIMLSQPIKSAGTAPIGLFPTYCLDRQSVSLRASYNFGSQTLLRNGLGTYQGRQVATHLTLKQGETTVADAKVTTLMTFAPSADFFNPDSTLTSIHSTSARLSGGVIAGAILTKVPPVYPVSAKQNHVSGTVILRAIIGRDGHIYSLRPMSAPDADLTIAAIAAVRQWTYKPYLLNGFPTSVDTTITVNFNLNPF